LQGSAAARRLLGTLGLNLNATRFDAFTFYATAVTSFLESAVPTYVRNLEPHFGDCPDVSNWLRQKWLPEELAHGRTIRQFVERLWPEFRWQAAYVAFLESYVPRCAHEHLRPSKALEALARCVTETEAAMMYRCLAAYTKDPELKRLLSQMSREEIGHYSYFRDVFNRHDAVERNSFWQKARTILNRSELVREEDVALAFRPLNHAWSGFMPFRAFSYAEFLAKAATTMSRHLPIEAGKRMLFRPLMSGRVWDSFVVEALAMIVRNQYAIEA